MGRGDVGGEGWFVRGRGEGRWHDGVLKIPRKPDRRRCWRGRSHKVRIDLMDLVSVLEKQDVEMLGDISCLLEDGAVSCERRVDALRNV